jgi:hypothetical protein
VRVDLSYDAHLVGNSFLVAAQVHLDVAILFLFLVSAPVFNYILVKISVKSDFIHVASSELQVVSVLELIE